jgi:hypothetical protein
MKLLNYGWVTVRRHETLRKSDRVFSAKIEFLRENRVEAKKKPAMIAWRLLTVGVLFTTI